MPLPPAENNPYYPLVADYKELTEEGKRLARVSLMQSWYNPKKPTDLITDPVAFVEAFKFFRSYYRKQSPTNSHKYAYKDPPSLHKEWIQDVAECRRNIITAFRDAGKSMVLCEELPEFVLISRPYTPVQYTTSADDLTEKQVRQVQIDIENNPQIINDFGKLRPLRTSGLIWRSDHIELANGAAMKGITAFSAQRGWTSHSSRPLLQLLDDWERDKRDQTPEAREGAEDYLFHVLFPMGEPGAWIVWPNTWLSKQSIAMRACDGVLDQFKTWRCKQYTPYYEEEVNGTKVKRSVWPDRFPVEDLEAMAGAGNERVVGIGQHAFDQEFLHKPGSKSGGAFEFDPQRHTYFWEGDHQKRILHDIETGREIDWEELKERSLRVIGSDMALGRQWSDYSANTAGAIDENGVLWVLETWEQKAGPMDTLYQALHMAEYWGAMAISVERVNFEQVAIDQLNEELNRRRMAGQFAPEVYVCNRAGAEAKKIRALRLQYRFREGRIKIPVQGPSKMPYGAGAVSLLDQVVGFSYSGGNLRHDDVLDSLLACHEAFAGIGQVAFDQKRAKGLIDYMQEAKKAGLRYWPGAQNVDAREITGALMQHEQKHRERMEMDDDLASLAAAFGGDIEEGGLFDFEY